MTSSIRIAQVFPELVGKKAHYDAYFHINDDAKECRYFSFTKKFILSHNSFKLLSQGVL